MKVTITGDGAMATVCAILLVRNGHKVRLWSYFPEALDALATDRENKRYLPGVRFPDSVEFVADDVAALAGADMILSAAPSQYVRPTWTRLAGSCPAGVPVVSVAKGVENSTLLRPTEVLAEIIGSDRPIAALSGPNIARELATDMPATAVAASADADFARLVQSALSTSTFRVYTNPDMLGVELGGAVKNVIAIAAGILDGLKAGDNAKAALLTRGLVEITRLGMAMGAKRETFFGLAGLGDLVTTCVSPHGRNRSFGQAIGEGRTMDEILSVTNSVVEGIATTRSVMELAVRYSVEMPITASVNCVLFEGKSVSDAIEELMTRSPKSENDAWA